MIVVTEVKTRHIRLMQQHPAMSAITTLKRQRIERVAQSFLRNNGPLCRRFRLNRLRIDAVEVYYKSCRFGLRRAERIIWHRGLECPPEKLFA